MCYTTYICYIKILLTSIYCVFEFVVFERFENSALALRDAIVISEKSRKKNFGKFYILSVFGCFKCWKTIHQRLQNWNLSTNEQLCLRYVTHGFSAMPWGKRATSTLTDYERVCWELRKLPAFFCCKLKDFLLFRFAWSCPPSALGLKRVDSQTGSPS